MIKHILLDSGVVSLLTHPRPSIQSQACGDWLEALLIGGDKAFLPEVTDFEVRREYLRRNNQRSLQELDALAQRIKFIHLETPIWQQAAILWAIARQRGHITAPPTDLDIDVLLAAQAQALVAPEIAVVIATTNVRHLAPFADARVWQQI